MRHLFSFAKNLLEKYTVNRFFPHLVEIDVLKLYNTFKIYLLRGIFIWTNLLSYLTQPMNANSARTVRLF